MATRKVKVKTKKNDLRLVKNRVDKYTRNLFYGVRKVLELEPNVQSFILYHMTILDTLYNQYTNPHISRVLEELEIDEEYKDSVIEDNEMSKGDLWDYQLAPMIRGKFIAGLQELILNGGMKKWEKVLDEIEHIFKEGKYK